MTLTISLRKKCEWDCEALWCQNCCHRREEEKLKFYLILMQNISIRWTKRNELNVKDNISLLMMLKALVLCSVKFCKFLVFLGMNFRQCAENSQLMWVMSRTDALGGKSLLTTCLLWRQEKLKINKVRDSHLTQIRDDVSTHQSAPAAPSSSHLV